MAITIQGTTFQSSVGTPWNIPSGVAMFVQAGSGGTVLDYEATRQRYMAEYGVDPLGLITPDPNSSVGSAAYNLSREYYFNNPSQRFQDLITQYAQQQGNTLTQGMYNSSSISRQPTYSQTPTFDMSTAAGIAAYTARQGGSITADLASIAATEGYSGPLSIVSGREMLATPSKTYAADVARTGATTILASDLSGPSATFYAPVGSYYKVELPDSKAVYSAAGEIGIYSPYYINGQLSKYLILSSSGGRNALQSGMFTVNDPMGSDVLSRTDLANFTSASALTIATKSRSGAEAYGGYEGITLDNRTIESTGAKLSTYANPANLANLVSPEAVNLGKAELPGAAFPWTINAGSPTIQLADQYGLTGKSINIGAQAQKSAGILDLSAGTYSIIGGETTKYTPSVQVAGLESPVAKQIAGTNLYLQPLGTAENVFGTGAKVGTTILEPASTIDLTTVPIVGMFASLAKSAGVPTVFEAGAIGQFFNPERKSVTTVGTPYSLPESTSIEKSITPITGGFETTTITTKTGGTVTPYLTSVSEIPGSSAFQKMFDKPITDWFSSLESGANKTLAENTAYQAQVAKISGEPQKPIINLGAFEPTQYTNALLTPIATEVVSQFKTAPVTGFTGKIAEGYALGEIFGGLGKAFEISKAGAVPLMESTGYGATAARAISTITTPIVENAGTIFGIAYGGNVAYKSTSGFTNFEPSTVATKAGETIAPDTLLFAGMGLHGGGSRIEETYSGIKTDFESYKSKIMEQGSTTPTLRVTTTEGEYVLSGGNVEAPTFGDYLKYKTQQQIPYETYDYLTASKGGLRSDIANIPAKVGNVADIARTTVIDTAPEYLYTGIEGLKTKISEAPATAYSAVMEPILSAKLTAAPRIEAALGRASIDIASWRYSEGSPLLESAYGKYFELSSKASVAAEQAFISTEVGAWKFGQYAKTPGITAKSLWQEYKPSIEWQGSPRYTYGLSFGKTATPSIGDISDAGTITGGGKPGAGTPSLGYERIGTRVVGGRAVSSLKAELPSTRIGEKSTKLGTGPTSIKVSTTETTGIFEGRVRTFGKPSETMKPLWGSGKSEGGGKQASAGNLILTERLQPIEGRVTERSAGISRTQPTGIQIVSTVQPTLEFGQQTERRRSVYSDISDIISPAAVTAITIRGVSGMEVARAATQERITSDISKVSTSYETLNRQISDIMSDLATAQAARTDQATLRETRMGYSNIRDIYRVSDIARLQDTEQTPERITDILPIRAVITSPITDTTFRQTPQTKITTEIIPTKIIIPGLPSVPGGSSFSLGGGRKRYTPFYELYHVGNFENIAGNIFGGSNQRRSAGRKLKIGKIKI